MHPAPAGRDREAELDRRPLYKASVSQNTAPPHLDVSDREPAINPSDRLGGFEAVRTQPLQHALCLLDRPANDLGRRQDFVNETD
jgi:hypothetical protein